MKKLLCLCAFIIVALVAVGCAPSSLWKSDPTAKQIQNEYFDAELLPFSIMAGYLGFDLTIHNKTANRLEVDWNKTFYLYDGKRNGGFTFEDTVLADRNKPKLPDIVAGNATFSKKIYPSNLFELSVIAGAPLHGEMKAGENGVYLTVIADGKEIAETHTFHFVKQ